jgi:hypothetical protein
MTWYRSFALIAFVLCLAGLAYHLIRLVRLGSPNDYSRRRGNVTAAVAYSFLGAMNPRKKESAYLHLPTYAAGLLYHGGTFISIVLFPLLFANVRIGDILQWSVAGFLTLSVGSGIGMFLKRITVGTIRSLSNPDDYLSNFLVTLFQLATLLMMVQDGFAMYYFVSVSLLLFYLPVGKLKHALYFFAARYHLGLFYGWRGIWPFRKS